MQYKRFLLVDHGKLPTKDLHKNLTVRRDLGKLRMNKKSVAGIYHPRKPPRTLRFCALFF
jgi:hypothetical protein